MFCSIAERVTPRLAHANAAVVLSAVKVGFNLVFFYWVRCLAMYISQLRIFECLYFLYIKNVKWTLSI